MDFKADAVQTAAVCADTESADPDVIKLVKAKIFQRYWNSLNSG